MSINFKYKKKISGAHLHVCAQRMQPFEEKRKYVFIVNGTRIEIEDEIVAKMKTLANMVIDVDSKASLR